MEFLLKNYSKEYKHNKRKWLEWNTKNKNKNKMINKWTTPNNITVPGCTRNHGRHLRYYCLVGRKRTRWAAFSVKTMQKLSFSTTVRSNFLYKRPPICCAFGCWLKLPNRCKTQLKKRNYYFHSFFLFWQVDPASLEWLVCMLHACPPRPRKRLSVRYHGRWITFPGLWGS